MVRTRDLPIHFEVDHLFVSVLKSAPEMDRLVAAGFEEGPPNVHPGQGTACRRIFFRRSFLELIWLEDVLEASSPLISPTGLSARAQMVEGVSRVGIGLRPTSEKPEQLPVETWSYRPPYLPEHMSIPVAANSSALHEPLIFFMPWSPGLSYRDRAHPNGAEAVTEITLTIPRDIDPSPELRWLGSSGCVGIDAGEHERVTLALDGGVEGATICLSPEAPLCLNW